MYSAGDPTEREHPYSLAGKLYPGRVARVNRAEIITHMTEAPDPETCATCVHWRPTTWTDGRPVRGRCIADGEEPHLETGRDDGCGEHVARMRL